MAIDCVVCFRDQSGSYFQYPYVTLLSIFRNTKEKINAHILHDSTIDHGKSHLKELCAAYGHDIFFHRVPDLPPDLASKIPSKYSIGIMYRYYVHEFVKADKAIYLDCDVVVNRDIADLYSCPLDDYLFAAVLDSRPYWRKGKPRAKFKQLIDYLGLKWETYINSGVLLINLARLREISGSENIFVGKTCEALNSGVTLPYPDMDIINSVAANTPNGMLLIDESFNLWQHAMHLSLAELEGKIFHCVSSPDTCFFPAHLLFWKYHAMTPFSGDMIEQMDAAYHTKPMQFVQYYLRNTRHRRHALELLQYGLPKMVVRAVGRKLGMVKG